METKASDVYEEKTPGHLAWGEFDVPDLKVEVVLVNLPKGRGCTLVPTKESVLKGFHNLKDMKAVLEQSLIRTRATLSLHDKVHCWHRGKKFDLTVTSLEPNTYNAVSCINTDIEVDFGSLNDDEDFEEKKTESASNTAKMIQENVTGQSLGRTLRSFNEAQKRNDNTTSLFMPTSRQ